MLVLLLKIGTRFFEEGKCESRPSRLSSIPLCPKRRKICTDSHVDFGGRGGEIRKACAFIRQLWDSHPPHRQLKPTSSIFPSWISLGRQKAPICIRRFFLHLYFRGFPFGSAKRTETGFQIKKENYLPCMGLFSFQERTLCLRILAR